ncbi:hypothetical protein FRX31_018675 [Thalictrum thalictroides]|uniref:Uncharacterized protein n=1 Tax=Thalictrum thalictroides TaxID=46969 RepID=A0A7J6W3H5_THATH|nr:hypothetical protein FRX31_018675 [Thalictrum thalictroides]
MHKWTPEYGALMGVEKKETRNNFEIDIDSLECWGGEETNVKINQANLEDIPRILFLEELGYKFPVVIEVVEEKSDSLDGGSKKVAVVESLKGKEVMNQRHSGDNRNDVIHPEAYKTITPPLGSNGEEDRTRMHYKDQGVPDKEWVQVSGKTRPVKEKTWAQVVSSNRYDPIQEVVAETQAHETVSRSMGFEPEAVIEAQQQPTGQLRSNSGKALSQSRSMSSSLPGLRLSRQLWPNTNKGGRNKFGRIKQLARQAINKEHLRHALAEISPALSNEEHHADSANNPINSSYRQFGEGTSKQQDDHHSSLKRILVKDQSEEVVEINDSESCPPGFEELSGNNSGVNFSKLIEQECCHLKSKCECLGEWSD